MDLPHRDPPSVDAPNLHLVASRQHSGVGPHPEGRGPQGETSAPGGREDSVSDGSSQSSHPSRLHPVGGEPPGGCSLTLPVGARLASRSLSVSADLVPVGSPPDRPLCVASVSADDALHVLEGCGLTRSHQRSQHEVELRSGLPVSSHSPPQEGREEAGVIEGGFFSSSLRIGRPRRGLPVSKRFQSWKSVVSPSTTSSWSTSRRGNPLHLWSGCF
jgi:hypothetical protein